VTAHLEIWKLTKSFPGPTGETAVVKDFELRVEKGEFVCLIGHSGCGKSTVLSMVAGLTRPTSGAIALAGKEVVGPGPDRGMVFQSPCLLPWMTALENVLLGVDQVFPHAGKQERVRLAAHYLELVGLGGAGAKRASELSAGMRQRAGIARAFAIAPKILLLDEPFGMLDSLTRCDLQEVLLELTRKQEKTALMVTHDVDEALFLSDRVVMMTSGPEARVGDVLEVPFARPRDRGRVMDHADYHTLRGRLLSFLEDQTGGGRSAPRRAPAAANGNGTVRTRELLPSAS
jgi:nitrate ABC transporter ATP-binding subunit